MARMTDLEAVFCRTRAWSWFAGRVVLPRVGADALHGRVLEIGCGAGAMAERVLALHPSVDELVATDVDPAMVERAAARLAGHGPRTRTATADAADLPFADGSFDAVVCWLCLHHTIAWERVVAEALRVLRPGGGLLGYDLPDTRASRAVHRLTGSTVRMVDPADLAAQLTAAAARDVEVAPLRALRPSGAYRFAAVR